MSAADLRAAVLRLGRAHASLRAAAAAATSEAQAEEDLKFDDWEKALEKLDPLRRGIEDMLEEAEAQAQGEDAHVQAVLRQRLQAERGVEAAERRCEEERGQIADLRRMVGELDASMAKDRRRRERLVAPRQERVKALEQRIAAAKSKAGDLAAEIEVVKSQLDESKAKNRGIDVRSLQLEREHNQAVEENLRARRALGGEYNLLTYRRSKEQERAEADATLERARAVYEAAMGAFDARWAEEQAMFHAGLREFEAEVKDLQEQLAEERRKAEANLARQVDEHAGALQDVEAHVAAELGRLEDLRQQRTNALRREVVHTRQQLEDASRDANRNLENHLKEAKHAYRTQLLHDEAMGDDVIQAELRAVADAKKEREEWEKKAAKVKENYRVHSVKSRTYVKSLDTKRKEQLVELWTKG
mmetsp:Transcript_122882/g.319549  ORF Transcript_122882/g.319549 Transcript_122882/m.319549 type:complete len:417 (-) Transcript_122882:76-1326(-)